MKRPFFTGLLVLCLLLGGCGSVAAESKATEQHAVQQTEDGTYPAGTFFWEGGSGRIRLTCEAVTIRSGAAYARIIFSSPNYEYVRVGEKKLEGTYTDETSTFEVPIHLDEEMELIGCTTAMSKPHEITYTIFVSLNESESSMSEATEGESDKAAQIRETVRTAVEQNAEMEIPDIAGLRYDHRMEPAYARCFEVFYYEGGYKVLSVIDGSRYLVVPEQKEIPNGLPEDMTVLKQPLDHNYVAATSAMSLFDAIDALDTVTLSGTDVSGWAIEAPKRALKEGRMTYSGKYREPDYERLVSSNCSLAVESTMILHAPEVREQLTALGIPVLTDWSSYERDVFGRMEWIRAYGALTNREDAADAHFRAECERVGDGSGYPSSGKTVAYLSVNSRKLAVVPRTEDYLVKMIRMGGADYAFSSLEESGRSASVNLSMEECYRDAAEADVLIYNGNIDGGVHSIADLIAKNELFADFRAVRNGAVYLSGSRLYQSTDSAAEFINDIHRIVTEEQPEQLRFLTKLT